MQRLVTCYYALALLALNGRLYEESERCLARAERLDKRLRSGIMETRRNDGSHYTKDEHGRFTGSTSAGGSGGSGGNSSGGGAEEGASGQSDVEAPYYAGLKDKLSVIKDKIKDKVTPEQYKEASQEYLASLPKLSEPESMDQALSAVNPKEYTNNCQRCVPVYEMRRRGYDVTAADAPINPLDDNIGLGDYKKVFVGSEWKVCQGSGKEEIAAYLKACGDGARVKITIDTDRGNHIFVAEQVKSATMFIDPQKGTVDADKYFQMRLTAKTKFCRIDNLAVSNLIKDCIER